MIDRHVHADRNHRRCGLNSTASSTLNQMRSGALPIHRIESFDSIGRQDITVEKLKITARALSLGRIDLAVAEAREGYHQAESLSTSAGEIIRELKRTGVIHLLHKNRLDLTQGVKGTEETALESITSPPATA